MLPGTFTLPIWFDQGATFAFALTGAFAGIRRGYDVAGFSSRSLRASAAAGGGLLRGTITARSRSYFVPASSMSSRHWLVR